MITLNVLFTIFVLLFGVIGAVRGLRKELVVVVSGIFALFTIQEVLPRLLGDLSGTKALLLELIVLFVCGFLGYQTPAFRRLSESGRFNRDTPIEIILGQSLELSTATGWWVQPGILLIEQLIPSLGSQPQTRQLKQVRRRLNFSKIWCHNYSMAMGFMRRLRSQF
jgi:hypothetical protein